MNDLKFAVRQLLKNKGFTAVAVLTLALGIGANTAIFGVMNARLFDPIPNQNEDRLLEINEVDQRESRRSGISAFLFQELRNRRETFDTVTASQSDAIQLVGGEFLEDVWGARVTSDFFDLFGERPLLGNWMPVEDTRPSAENVIVISHAWWKSRFGGDPAIVGQRLKTRDAQGTDTIYTVIGVMGPQFQLPSKETKYWRPLRFSSSELSEPEGRNYEVFARLAPGASVERVQSLFATLTTRMTGEFPQAYSETKHYVIQSRPLKGFFVAPEVRRALWSVAAALGLVLVIVCANLGSLQLAHGEKRAREMWIRVTLGASRWRVMRQRLAESLLLALLGGASGLLVAVWLRPVLESLVPAGAPVLRSGGVDGAMIGWTFGVASVCGIVFGNYPAWMASNCRLGDALRSSAQTFAGMRRQQWVRPSLVVTQVALTVVLLTGSGLLIRSVAKLLAVDPGLNPKGLVTVWPDLHSRDLLTSEQQSTVTREITERFSGLPGTIAVGVSKGRGSSYHYLPDNPEPFRVSVVLVGTGGMDYFGAIGARLKEGRWLSASDNTKDRSAEVLVNETLAGQFWPGESAIGKRFYDVGPKQQADGPRQAYDVVGVVHNFSEGNLGTEQRPTCFVPLTGYREPMGTVYHVRTALDSASFMTGVRQVCKEVSPGGRAPEMVWVESDLYASTATRRMLTGLLSALGATALFLAMLGVFGVLLHTVARRTKEIGIRLALGAQQRDVLFMVLLQGLKLVGVGTLIGLGGALVLTRMLRGMLFGVSPDDAATFATLPLLLIGAGLLACLIPARRATRINPMEALRNE